MIPEANWSNSFYDYEGISIIKVNNIRDVLNLCIIDDLSSKIDILSAKGKE